ncbi:heterokaryon incompatibility protein-domain-containing protein, partial [Diaporthe sp. PMI_573]
MANNGYQEISSTCPNQSQTAHDCVPLPHPDRQIRVLHLNPVYSSDPNTAPALQGHLRVVSLPTNQDYSAISYVWAQKDPGTSGRENQLVINCNGHQHNVQLGLNCWSALWHIVKIKGSLLLWIDAVCIDQRSDGGDDSNEEKLQQIPLMRTIYASAYTTYFWLGEAAKGTDQAMDYLLQSKLSISTGSIGDKWGAVFELFRYCAVFSVPPHQAGLEEIFNRPWIRRLWVLQE